MSVKNSRFTPNSRSLARSLASAIMLGATLLVATPVQAAFHLWNIREVYTDSSGTLQFIELVDPAGGQPLVGGRTITVSSGGTNHVLTLTTNVPNDAVNSAILIGTANITNFGAPAPNYIIPSNFLFAGGGSISFFGANSGPYTALPTDGSLSRTWTGGNAVNSPQNFAGTIGQIAFPNLPPVVSITTPSNTSLFAAPGFVPIGVSATDDGSVANVQLFTNGVVAVTNTVAPFGFTLSNLTAGYYTLRARAQDNQSAAATSAPVTVRVASKPVLSFARGTNGPIRFQFNSSTGINYVVDRGVLTNFSPVVTNAGSGSAIPYSETNGVPPQGTYRVRLQ